MCDKMMVSLINIHMIRLMFIQRIYYLIDSINQYNMKGSIKRQGFKRDDKTKKNKKTNNRILFNCNNNNEGHVNLFLLLLIPLHYSVQHSNLSRSFPFTNVRFGYRKTTEQKQTNKNKH